MRHPSPRTGLALALAGLVVAPLTAACTPTTSAPASTATNAVVTVDDAVKGTASRQFEYLGTGWTNCGGCATTAQGTSYHYSDHTGNKVTFRFTGTKITLMGVKEPVSGIGSVVLDGKVQPDIDLFASTKFVAGIYASPTLANTPHTLSITVSGRRNALARANNITIDAAKVTTSTSTSTTAPAPVTTTAPAPAPAPTTAPAPAPTSANPIGSTGARSGLAWNSGIWPLGRGGSATSYNSALSYAEGRRGKPSDINMSMQYANSWGDITGLQVLDFLNATPSATPVLMLPPFPQGGSWTAAAGGSYDAYYRQIGANIAAKRPGAKTVLRFAHEANGDWYWYSIVKTGGATNFVNGWRRAVDQMRLGAGAKASNIVMDYSLSNLDNKGQGDPLTVTYPGDQWVDVIGLDIYDHWQVTTSPTVPGKAADMNRAYAFAKLHRKWISLDEWGLHHTANGDPEGGDNPNFVSAMYTWMKAHRDILAWESYFQDDATNNVNSSLFSSAKDANPTSRSAYLGNAR